VKRQESTPGEQKSASKMSVPKPSWIDRSKSASPFSLSGVRAIGTAERKRIMDFMQKTAKEMKVIEKLKESPKRSTEKTVPRMGTAKSKGRVATPEKLFDGKYMTPCRSLERLLSTDRECTLVFYGKIFCIRLHHWQSQTH
jgi:hypothetical protein